MHRDLRLDATGTEDDDDSFRPVSALFFHFLSDQPGLLPGFLNTFLRTSLFEITTTFCWLFSFSHRDLVVGSTDKYLLYQNFLFIKSFARARRLVLCWFYLRFTHNLWFSHTMELYSRLFYDCFKY